jgi:hypothetical protein
VVIQPQKLCELLKVKNVEDAERVLSLAFAFLAYMSPGDELQTSDISIKKLDNNLLYIDSDTDLTTVVDSLERKRVLRIPV